MAVTLPASLRQEFLVCSLCHDGFDTPKILPCLHTFCMRCLDGHLKKSTTASASLWFLCPQCRQITDVPSSGVSGFKTNTFIHNLKRFVESRNRITETKDVPGGFARDTVYGSAQLNVPGSRPASIDRTDDGKCRKGSSGGEICDCACGDRAVRFYCETCERLVCAECMLDDHKTHTILRLEERANKDRDRFISVVHDSRKEVTSINSGIDDMEKYKVQLRTSRNEAASKVKEHAAMLRKLIDLEEDCMIKEIDRVFNGETDKTDKIIKEHRNVTVILKSLTNFSNKLLKSGSHSEVVVWSAHAQSQLRTISNRERKYGVDRIRRNPIQIRFNARESNYKTALKSLLGEVQYGVNVNILDSDTNANEQRSSDQRLKDLDSHQLTNDERIMRSKIHRGRFVKSFSSFTDGSRFSPITVGITMTPRGDILIVDKNNKCVKFFGADGGMYKKIHGSESLWGATVLQDGKITITDRTVHVFDARGKLEKVLRQQPRDSHGIATNSSGDVIVADCMSRCIYIMSVLGGTIQRIITQRGRQPFKCPAYVAVNGKDQVIVADCGAHCVSIFSNKGQHICDHGVPEKPGAGPGLLDCPSGICIDKLDNILICDKNNDRIVLLDPRGRFMCVVVEGQDVLQRPQAVCVDREGRLLVAEEEGMVKIFKYRENL